MTRISPSHWTIAQRLCLGFGALLSIMALVTGLCVNELHQRGLQVRTIVDVNNVKTALAGGMLEQIDGMALHARMIVMLTIVSDVEKEVSQFGRAKAAYLEHERQLLSVMAAHGMSDDETRLTTAISRHALLSPTPAVWRAST